MIGIPAVERIPAAHIWKLEIIRSNLLRPNHLDRFVASTPDMTTTPLLLSTLAFYLVASEYSAAL